MRSRIQLTDKVIPKKDITTSWNYTLGMIDRLERLKATVLAYIDQLPDRSKCPELDRETFKVLRLISTILQQFKDSTLEFSSTTPSIHKVLLAYDCLLTPLRLIQSKAPEDQQFYLDKPILKLLKYFTYAHDNNWVCSTFVLDPQYRTNGLVGLLKKHNHSERLVLVTKFIQARILVAQARADSLNNEPAGAPVNEFCSFPSITSTSVTCTINEWAEYCKSTHLGLTLETPLQYWKRKHLIYPHMSSITRDILSLSGSLTDVERLFSAAGCITDPRRGSLSLKMVSKPTSAKVWLRQKIVRSS